MAESSLLADIARGQADAVARCMDRYGGLVWSLARRLSGSEMEAEDAAQEIFVEVWKSAHRYDATKSSEASFIAMIARRRLIDRLRKRKLNLEKNYEVDELVSGADAIQQVDVQDEVAQTLTNLQQLPEAQSKVIMLAVYHGMSHSKISAATGMPLGTVKSNLRRGLAQLREMLHDSRAK